jgi:hypothetical protein
MLTEKRPIRKALEVLSLLNSFGYLLWQYCAICYRLGNASVAVMRNRSFLSKMRISLLKYFFTLGLSFYL